MGKVFQRQGNYQDGISLLSSRLPKEDKGYFVGLILERLGLLYLSADQLVQSGEYYQRALAVWREMGSEWKGAIAQHGFAGVLSKQGKWIEAINLLEKSLQTLENIGDIDGVARVLSRLARAKIGTGDLQQAVTLAERSKALYEELGNRFSWALVLNILALAYKKVGNFDKALICYEQSLVVAQEDGNFARQIETLLNLARTHISMDDPQGALAYATKALDLTQDLQVPRLRKETTELVNSLRERSDNNDLTG